MGDEHNLCYLNSIMSIRWGQYVSKMDIGKYCEHLNAFYVVHKMLKLFWNVFEIKWDLGQNWDFYLLSIWEVDIFYLYHFNMPWTLVWSGKNWRVYVTLEGNRWDITERYVRERTWEIAKLFQIFQLFLFQT